MNYIKNKVCNILNNILTKLYDNTYDDYELNYNETEDSQSYRYYSEPVQPFFISEKAQNLLAFGGKNFNKIFNDCSIYIYGYQYGDVTERTLSKNIIAGGHPFNDVILKTIQFGKAERFEVVSNKDLFVYFGGGIGSYGNAPMIISNLDVFEDTVMHVSMTVNF